MTDLRKCRRPTTGVISDWYELRVVTCLVPGRLQEILLFSNNIDSIWFLENASSHLDYDEQDDRHHSYMALPDPHLFSPITLLSAVG
jgi:hypothetical protein